MFDLGSLNKTIHERGRLGIMTLLATRAAWSFQELKTELKMSDGNLITHLRTLHEAGLVAIIKEVQDRPQTSYALTEKGKKEFRAYLDVLEQILAAGRTPPK
jgi:DNA-binding HxlR family transcriptional regulator